MHRAKGLGLMGSTGSVDGDGACAFVILREGSARLYFYDRNRRRHQGISVFY